MKKLILSALLMGTAAMAANAQANSVLAFGNVGFHYNSVDGGDKTREFNINPGVGYQFDHHWTLGVTGSYGSNGLKIPGASSWANVNSYSAGAFLRYTCPVGKIFAFYNQLEAGYIGQSIGGASISGFKASWTPAVAVYVYDGFALNFSYGGIDYTTMSGTQDFNFTWGKQFNVGISKNFSCHKHKHHGMKMNHGSQVDKEDMEDGDDK